MADNSFIAGVTKQLSQILKGDVSTNSQKKALALNENIFARGAINFDDVQKNGLKKPSKISFQNLRQIAKYDPIIRICINVIKKEVSQASWAIVPKRDGVPANQEHIDWAYALFSRVNENGENLRELLDRILEDVLTLDAGPIEKVKNAKGEILELNSVDGATIRPVVNVKGELDPSRGYVQVINNKVVAEFKADEIIYIMQSPQNDINNFGYGLSPIESILLTVQSSLNAEMYNSRTFSEDNIPPGVLDLGDMTEEEAQQFRALWDATTIGSTQKMKFVWGKANGSRFVPFNKGNKDMQFVEYIDWLSRLKLATYGLSTLDANITQDVNRSTAQSQEHITNSRGVKSVKRVLEDYINREIFMEMGMDTIAFRFEESSSLEEKRKQAEIDKIYIEAGVYTPADVAMREGIESSILGGILEESKEDEEDLELLQEEEEEVEVQVEEDVNKVVKKSKYKPLYN